MRWVLVAWLLSLLASTPAGAQTYADKLVVGASDSPNTASVLRVVGLGARTAGQDVLGIDSNGDVTRGLLGTADIPSVFGRTDTTNTWALLQTFTSGLTSNGNVTIGGANDLVLGTGGMRVPSGSILLRNTGDSANIATFGNAAIALNQPTTITGNSSVTGTWGVSSLATLTGGFSAGATSSIAGDLSLTGTGAITAAGDVAVNGGDITSTAATLNMDAGGTVQINDALVMAASNTVRSANFASRTTGWGITYAGEADFRYTYADEFYTKSFIADLETALNGGQVIAKSTVVLSQAFTCPAASGTATLWVRDFPGHGNLRVFAANDWVVLRAMSRADADADGNIEFSIADCVGQVSAYADGTSGNEGTQSWTFTRGAGGNAGSMAASTVVAVDALAIDFGVSGQGFLVARANDGTEGDQSPYWQAVTWTTAPVAANMAVQTRWGQLNGSYGYSTAAYGFAAGPSTAQHVTVDPTNGFRVRSNTTTWAQLAGSGLTLGVTATGNGNLFADTSGNLFLRSGLVTRMTLAAANGTTTFHDPAGVARLQVGSAAITFLGTDGGVNGYIQGTSASPDIVLGATTTGKPYFYASGTQLGFCAANINCSITLYGSTGDIDMSGNLKLSSGGNITSTGNFSISNSVGLRFTPTTSFSAAKAVQWGDPASGAHSWIAGYTNGQLNFKSNNGTANAYVELYRSSTYHTLVLGQTAVSSQDVQFLPGDTTGTARIGNTSVQWDAVYATNYYAGTTIGYSGTIPVSASCNLVVSGGLVTNYTGVCP